jgi:hypothetical protein
VRFRVLKRFELVVDIDDECQVSFCSTLPSLYFAYHGCYSLKGASWIISSTL